jgi:hypothetical protein
MTKTLHRSGPKTGFIIFILVIVALVVFVAYAGFSFLKWFFQSDGFMFSSDMCGNDIYQEVYSSDRQYKVVVFERDCGATTGFSTQLSILEAQQELSNVPGNIFDIDGHPDYTNVHVKWKGNHRVSITYADGYEVHYQQETLKGSSQVFEIQYEVATNE